MLNVGHAVCMLRSENHEYIAFQKAALGLQTPLRQRQLSTHSEQRRAPFLDNWFLEYDSCGLLSEQLEHTNCLAVP